jgi:hypothetical protein
MVSQRIGCQACSRKELKKGINGKAGELSQPEAACRNIEGWAMPTLHSVRR